MTEREYDEKSLIEYLLGALPDEKAERFDELSFTDDDFSNDLKTTENDLIDAYLHDELRGADLERFNTYYLASPRRREKVEFAKSLQIYAGKNIAPVAVKTSGEFVEKTGLFASWKLFSNPFFGWTAAALALVIVTVGGFWISGRLSQPEPEIVSSGANTVTPDNSLPLRNNDNATIPSETANGALPSSEIKKEKTAKTPAAESSRTPKTEKPASPPRIAVASFILAPPLRGNGLPIVAFPRETELILMTLKTESDDYKSYQVALTDESNKKIWQSDKVKLRNAAINVSFPANLLKSRVYSLVVSGIGTGGEAEIISNYPFRAAPK